MKIVKLSLFVALATFSFQCTAQKQQQQKVNSPSVKTSQENIQKIELEEMTRGTRKMAVFTPSDKNVSLNDSSSRKTFSSTEWNNIVKAVSAIDLSRIESYPAPTQARFHDGALAATIRIHKNGKVYSSQSFDSGKPPKELSALYKLLAPAFTSK